MKNIYIKFRKHPGDVFRNTEKSIIPNPIKNQEDFLVNFLTHYQSDQRIADLDDLYKVLYNEFSDEIYENTLLNQKEIDTKTDLQNQIDELEEELMREAYRNFYEWILVGRIEVYTMDLFIKD